MRYPVVIEPGDALHAYGVVVPDLPGCFSAGDTMDEALEGAKEAILLHLEGLVASGLAIPSAGQVERYKDNPDYAGWIWALVEVDLTEIQGPARRVNITVPEQLLRVIDQAAKAAGESRSGFMARAAMEQAGKSSPINPGD